MLACSCVVIPMSTGKAFPGDLDLCKLWERDGDYTGNLEICRLGNGSSVVQPVAWDWVIEGTSQMLLSAWSPGSFHVPDIVQLWASFHQERVTSPDGLASQICGILFFNSC